MHKWAALIGHRVINNSIKRKHRIERKRVLGTLKG